MEDAVDRVLLGMSLKLRKLEDRYQDLVNQCRRERHPEQSPDFPSLTKSLHLLRQRQQQLSHEMQRLLHNYKPQEAPTQVYSSISSAISEAQSGFLRLLHTAVPEFQAKAQATDLFVDLSDRLWTEIYRLRTHTEEQGNTPWLQEVLNTERRKAAIDGEINELWERLKGSLEWKLAVERGRITALQSELKAGQEGRLYRSSSPDRPLQTWASSEGTRSARNASTPVLSDSDPRLESIKKQVDTLKSRLSASLHARAKVEMRLLQQHSDTQDRKALMALIAETKNYIKVTKNHVRHIPEAVKSLRTLVRIVNDSLLDGKTELLKESMKSVDEKDNSSLGDTQKYDSELVTRLTKEVKDLTEHRIELEKVVEQETEKLRTQRAEHELAMADVIRDCQELTEELKTAQRNVRNGESAAKKREEELISRVKSLEKEKAAVRESIGSLVEKAAERLRSDYLQLEKRMMKADTRLSQAETELETHIQRFTKHQKSQANKRQFETILEEMKARLNATLETGTLLSRKLEEEKSTNRELSKLNSQYLKQVETTEEQNQILRTENERLQKALASQRNSTEQELKVEELRAQCDLLQSKHAGELLDIRNKCEARVRELQAEKDSLENEVQRLKKDAANKSTQLLEANSEPALQLSELQRSKEELETSRRALEREVERQQALFVKLKGDQVHLETELSRTKSARMQNELLQRSNDQLQSQLHSLAQEHAKLKARVNASELAGDVEDYEERIGVLKQQLRERVDATSAMEEMCKQTVAVAEKKEEELSENIASLTAALQESNHMLDSVTSQFTAIDRELRFIASELSLKGDTLDSILMGIRSVLRRPDQKPVKTDSSESRNARRGSESKAGVVSRGVSPVSHRESPCEDCKQQRKDLEILRTTHSEQIAKLQSEIDHLKLECKTLSNQLELANEDRDGLNTLLGYEREEHEKKIREKDQFIAMLQANTDFEPPLAIVRSEHSQFTPDEEALIEEQSSADEKDVSFHGNLRDLLDLTPVSEHIRPKSDLSQVIDVLQPLVGLYTTPVNAAMEVAEELKALRSEVVVFREKDESDTMYRGMGQSLHSYVASSNEVHTPHDLSSISELHEKLKRQNEELANQQRESKKLEDLVHVLQTELRAVSSKTQGMILPHLKAAVIALAAELPSLSQKGEELLRTIYSYLELDSRQTGLLERARKAKRGDKSLLLSQVLA